MCKQLILILALSMLICSLASAQIDKDSLKVAIKIDSAQIKSLTEQLTNYQDTLQKLTTRKTETETLIAQVQGAIFALTEQHTKCTERLNKANTLLDENIKRKK
jgi:hypothetical protein